MRFFYFLISEVLFNATTCNTDAYLRGPGQKVVAYSFYGDMNSTKSKKKGISNDYIWLYLFSLITAYNLFVIIHIYFPKDISKELLKTYI